MDRTQYTPMLAFFFFFFFQEEDGIRDLTVTGVQTCALPIFEYFDKLSPMIAIANGPIDYKTPFAFVALALSDAKADFLPIVRVLTTIKRHRPLSVSLGTRKSLEMVGASNTVARHNWGRIDQDHIPNSCHSVCHHPTHYIQ